MWVKSTDIGDKSEMSPKSVSFTLSGMGSHDTTHESAKKKCLRFYNSIILVMRDYHEVLVTIKF